MSDQRGFSLMEALVALLVIGIAAAGVIRATQSHVDSIRDLELRAAAQWVAENRLAELSLAGDRRRDGEETVDMMGRRWSVTTALRRTDDPDLRQAIVSVRTPGSGAPLLTLDGFVDAGTVTQ